MEQGYHSMQALFDQLGLPSSEEEIGNFIADHDLAAETRLHEAGFWSVQQASFLRSAVAEDADWAEVVDHLDARLRK